LDYVNITALTT